MFVDRIEIYSPGTIPNTMTVGSLIYRQAARHETPTSQPAKCPVPSDIEWVNTERYTLMDKRGEGVRINHAINKRLLLSIDIVNAQNYYKYTGNKVTLLYNLSDAWCYNPKLIPDRLYAPFI
jgi:predicted HTH transcriptional regulator